MSPHVVWAGAQGYDVHGKLATPLLLVRGRARPAGVSVPGIRLLRKGHNICTAASTIPKLVPILVAIGCVHMRTNVHAPATLVPETKRTIPKRTMQSLVQSRLAAIACAPTLLQGVLRGAGFQSQLQLRVCLHRGGATPDRAWFGCQPWYRAAGPGAPNLEGALRQPVEVASGRPAHTPDKPFFSRATRMMLILPDKNPETRVSSPALASQPGTQHSPTAERACRGLGPIAASGLPRRSTTSSVARAPPASTPAFACARPRPRCRPERLEIPSRGPARPGETGTSGRAWVAPQTCAGGAARRRGARRRQWRLGKRRARARAWRSGEADARRSGEAVEWSRGETEKPRSGEAESRGAEKQRAEARRRVRRGEAEKQRC